MRPPPDHSKLEFGTRFDSGGSWVYGVFVIVLCVIAIAIVVIYG